MRAALWFGRAKRPLTLWSMGVNQSSSGTAKALALLNLHLATGTVGKPGCGPLSLTGQPNAMGGREVGGMAQLLPGYRRVEQPAHRAAVARLWGCPPERISARPGLTAVEMFEALALVRSRRSGLSAPIRPSRCRNSIWSSGRCAMRNWSWCRIPITRLTHPPLRRRAAARGAMAGKNRRDDEFGAAHLVGSAAHGATRRSAP